MHSDDEYEPDAEGPSVPLKQRVWKRLGKRWVQVCLILAVGAIAVVASGLVLVPSSKPQPNRDTSQFKYLYCPKCEYETRYDPALDGEDCKKCAQEPVGILVGSATSIKDTAGKSSPWKWFYLTASLEIVAAVGAVLYLLYLPQSDPAATFYVFSCPYCTQRLRFRKVSLGGLGQCSRCKRPLRFPEEDQAVLEEDLMREENERLEALAAENEDEDD